MHGPYCLLPHELLPQAQIPIGSLNTEQLTYDPLPKNNKFLGEPVSFVKNRKFTSQPLTLIALPLAISN
jgi:hypothetical protein